MKEIEVQEVPCIRIITVELDVYSLSCKQNLLYSLLIDCCGNFFFFKLGDHFVFKNQGNSISKRD